MTDPPGRTVADDTVSPSDSTGVFGLVGGFAGGLVGRPVVGGFVGGVVGGSVLGGSVLGGSVFGGSVFGGSVLGGSVLGGSVLGGSVFGGSVFGGSVLGGSVFGGSLGVSLGVPPGGSLGDPLGVPDAPPLGSAVGSAAVTGGVAVPMSATAPSPARIDPADRERTLNAPPPRRGRLRELCRIGWKHAPRTRINPVHRTPGQPPVYGHPEFLDCHDIDH
ncbi:hypothetical protein FXF65_04700 [Actinomadura syzygii]|uniref:Uncharacterized protein n=1 Tax=Actinomadura syzygii TaxID=1427538 RepID=A0A5D0UHT0_9ACTN|nr:hypothetical protein FXF65_04700 [Actinomadura syzygii]